MKTFILSAAIGLFAALTQAVAIPAEVEARQYMAQLTFNGANPPVASYTVSVPTDGSVIAINNPLSITTITGQAGAVCAARGVDGSLTIIVGAETVPVGPPQTQISVSCKKQ